MSALDALKALILFQLRKSRHSAPTVIASPLAIAFTAIVVLPYALSRSYGAEVAKSILAGYIPLLAILAALPAAIIAVIEASAGRYNHLLLSGVSQYFISVSIFFVNAILSLIIVVLGLLLSKTLYNFPSHKSIGLVASLVFLGTVGISGLAVAVSYPFRNPQISGLIVSLLVILFEYLSPVYYPITALPRTWANVVLAINPLASVMGFLRGTFSLKFTMLVAIPSSILWIVVGIVFLSRKIVKTI